MRLINNRPIIQLLSFRTCISNFHFVLELYIKLSFRTRISNFHFELLYQTFILHLYTKLSFFIRYQTCMLYVYLFNVENCIIFFRVECNITLDVEFVGALCALCKEQCTLCVYIVHTLYTLYDIPNYTIYVLEAAKVALSHILM